MPLPNPWIRFSVELSILERLVGGIPASKDLIKIWTAANMPSVSEAERAKLVEKTVEELGQVTEDKAVGMTTMFKQDATGIYIEGRQVKAMFKENANILRDLLLKGEAADKRKADKAAKADEAAKTDDARATKMKARFTNLKSKVAERLFVEESHIHFHRADQTLKAADGQEEKAIHVMTPQGERTALKRITFVEAPATLKFTIRFLADGVVDAELVKYILEYAGWNGLGGERSQGNGRFSVVAVTEVEETA